MSEYVREDGSAAVEPVKKNELVGTYTDAEGKQVFPKESGGGGAIDLGPISAKLALVIAQQSVIIAQQKKIMEALGL